MSVLGYHWLPRLYLLCQRYRLSAVEAAVMHIAVIVQVRIRPHIPFAIDCDHDYDSC